jgi:hypothetical protein
LANSPFTFTGPAIPIGISAEPTFISIPVRMLPWAKLEFGVSEALMRSRETPACFSIREQRMISASRQASRTFFGSEATTSSKMTVSSCCCLMPPAK